MSRITARIGSALFAVAVAVVMAFGATELVASSPSSSDCWRPQSGFFGECINDDHCKQICSWYGLIPGACGPDNCCVCAI